MIYFLFLEAIGINIKVHIDRQLESFTFEIGLS